MAGMGEKSGWKTIPAVVLPLDEVDRRQTVERRLTRKAPRLMLAEIDENLIHTPPAAQVRT